MEQRCARDGGDGVGRCEELWSGVGGGLGGVRWVWVWLGMRSFGAVLEGVGGFRWCGWG